ncbi:hypothetical protein [Metabacillus malikii]|uniref:Uncharacterized protein n=1 Tax=Metabacillus malikii TaxID=1504265 RepID=A0ABT9ZEG1_9BACI|nr:hypothetical protein [Metabacillus malikii]MDQ0230650.1 hypothetical protein [Metabacillus malikii]
MGYILPIQQDTYTQYANRFSKIQGHYSHIVAPQRAASIQREQKKATEKQQKKFSQVLEEKMFEQEVKNSLTGKGNHINLLG